LRKPIIGITASFEEQHKIVITRHYSDWILRVGGLPMIIPYVEDTDVIRGYIDEIDGLLLSGGGDIDPTLFGEEPHPGLGNITPERDKLEVSLSQEMMKRNKPILAICRGAQILNIAAGGTMYQDIHLQFPSENRYQLLQHSQHAPTWHPTHHVEIEQGSQLHRILGMDQCKTNSFHHQAIKDPAPGFSIVGKSKDRIIEAIESKEHYYIIGVQWHPECKNAEDQVSERLFSSFVQACNQ
jgi:putative glutamine amidotransferase